MRSVARCLLTPAPEQEEDVLARLAVTVDDPDEWSPSVAIAGAIAGFVADTLLHPFDTVSHRAKVHPTSRYGSFAGSMGLIVKEEGFRGLLAGVSVTASYAGPASATYFAAYHALKDRGLVYAKSERDKQVLYLLCGAGAELASASVFLPCEVVKCRLQLGENPARATGGVVSRTVNYRGPIDAVRCMVREEGLASLWSGWRASILQDCVNSAITFLVYENVRAVIRAWTGKEPTAFASFAAGGLAGGLAAALTNPLDTITARMMTQDARADRKGFGSGIGDVVRTAIAEGPGSLWRGTLVRVMHAVPSAAVQFAVFEAVRGWLDARSKGPPPPPPHSGVQESRRTAGASAGSGGPVSVASHSAAWVPAGVWSTSGMEWRQ